MTLNAGAGSGKTSVLTDRIVATLESGVAPANLAAITFTEKAAGELLARVRDRLEARLVEAAAAGEAARAALLTGVLDRFGELTLATIHSFCRDILRRESLESGFAPETEIGDEGAERERVSVEVRAWLAALRTRRPGLWRVLEGLTSFWCLRTAAQSLYRYRQLRDHVSDEPFDAITARGELRALWAAIGEAGEACACPEEDVLIRGNRRLTELIARAVEAADPQDGVLEVLLSDTPPRRRGGKKKDWGSDRHRQAYLDALAGVTPWRERWRERAHGEVVRELRASLLPRLEAARLEASSAGFDDLLADAARVLRERRSARERLACRYRVVLIDEVQDTDPVQAEVALLLTRALEETGAWHERPPEPGRLFAVGDPKQSIYRFRGADVTTFSRLERVVPEENRASLSRNFRSVPGLCAWFNHVFAELPGYEPQTAHREPGRLDPVVLLQASSAVDETEAALRYLHEQLETGAQIIDRESGQPRPLEPRDVMLLLPAWTRADGIADRLRASGLECIVEGGDTFFSRDEVRLGVAALRAVVEPADGEAVVFTLRGLFGISLEALAEHVAAQGSFRYTLPSPPPGAVADALAVLLRLHRRSGAAGLTLLLDELLAATRAPAVWSLLPDGDARLANLDKLRALVRAAEERTTSPLGALEELRRVEREVKDKDLDRIDDDGNAIRITSLFKAKGLEAPLVVLLHARRAVSGVTTVVDEAGGTLAVTLGGLRPPGWEAAAERERGLQRDERRRWTYVAATRARDQLVVCRPPGGAAPAGGGDEDGPREDLRDLLAEELDPRGLPPSEGLVDRELVELTEGVRVRVRLGDGLPPVERPAETYPGRDAEVDALLARPPATGDPDGEARAAAQGKRVRAATRRCLRWRAASQADRPVRWTPGPPVEGARVESVGTRGGQVVHAVMERLDLSRPRAELLEVAAELCDLLARQAGLPEGKREACGRIVARILANPLLEKARRAPERWHEVPFTYEARAGSIISGTIDLCFPVDATRERWVVFDWKSRVPPKEDPLHAHYREQLKRYAEALLKSLGTAVEVETEIVGPHPELGDVAVTADEVLLDVRGDLRAPLGELLERGAPMPRVGLDVGEPALTVELAWEQQRLAIAPDLAEEERVALAAQGWTVRARLEVEEAAGLLGLAAVVGEAAEAEEEDG